MKTKPAAGLSAAFTAASIASARNDTPPLRDTGALLHAARRAFAAEQLPAEPRWTDEFAALFGSARALACCAIFTLSLGSFAALHVTDQIGELTAFIELTSPLWEVSA